MRGSTSSLAGRVADLFPTLLPSTHPSCSYLDRPSTAPDHRELYPVRAPLLALSQLLAPTSTSRPFAAAAMSSPRRRIETDVMKLCVPAFLLFTRTGDRVA